MLTLLSDIPKPRSNFRPAGTVASAETSSRAPFPLTSSRNHLGYRVKMGIRYEASVHRYIRETIENLPHLAYFPSQWFRYTDKLGRRRFCQPDGILINKKLGHALILEVKFTHTHEAWHQLLRKYVPVLTAYFRGKFEVGVLEVCRTMQKDVNFDVTFTLPTSNPEVPTILVLPNLKL